MKSRSFLRNFFLFGLPSALAVATLVTSLMETRAAGPTAAKPLKVLIVAGGCCHDYATQGMLLAEGLSARANVEVTVDHNPDKTTKAIKFTIR
jgi:hypothetical protein